MTEQDVTQIPNWPKVRENGPELRKMAPGWDGTKCFYCSEPVGNLHKYDCVIVNKIVKVKIEITMDRMVPYGWEPHTIDFHLNDSSWCASNIIDDLVTLQEKLDKEGTCLCHQFEGKYIEDVNITPIYSEK